MKKKEEEPEVKEQIGIQGIHDLFSREIRPLRNWSEWLDRWQSAVSIEEMLGLLHMGLTVSTKTSHDIEPAVSPFEFYLKIADGWAFESNFITDNRDYTTGYVYGKDQYGHPCNVSLGNLRRIVAQKAFDELCIHYFKCTPYQHQGYSEDKDAWVERWREKVDARKLELLMSFFKIEDNQLKNLQRGLRHSHNEKLAVDFLLHLAVFIWQWKDREVGDWMTPSNREKWIDKNNRFRDLLGKAKLWMIEVLADLHEIGQLHNRHIYKLDKACLDKIKEIAMRVQFESHASLQVLGFNETRPVATLEEACYAGSPCAWFLKKYELVSNEDERLKALAEAEKERRKVEARIKELQPATA